MSLLLLAGLMASEPVSREIRYEIAAKDAPVSNTFYSFYEKDLRFAGNSGVFVSYASERFGDVVGLSFNDMNVPRNLDGHRNWKFKSYTCSSRPKEVGSRSLLIVCNQKSGPNRTVVYAYERGKGITGFFEKCFLEKECWYQLKSTRGLLANTP